MRPWPSEEIAGAHAGVPLGVVDLIPKIERFSVEPACSRVCRNRAEEPRLQWGGELGHDRPQWVPLARAERQ